MRKVAVIGAIAVALVAARAGEARAERQCPPCGPQYCLGDPVYPKALAWKKARLRRFGYPERLIALLDREAPCVGCVITAPDGFHVQIVYDDKRTLSLGWTRALERQVRADLRAGRIKAFFLMNAAHACACCGTSDDYTKRRDWDERLDVNTDLTIGYKTPSELGPDPDDLNEPEVDPEAELNTPPPPVPAIPEPRQAHPLCPACQKEADEVNSWRRRIVDEEREVARLRRELQQAERDARRAHNQAIREHVEKGRASKATRERIDTAAKQVASSRAIADKRAGELALDQRIAEEKEAELLACQRDKCEPKPQTTTPPPPPPPATPPRTGWRPDGAVGLQVGGSFGLKDADHQMVVGLVAMLRVLPRDLRGYLVLAPWVAFFGGSVTLGLPIGFQYDFALPRVPTLFVYARLSLGYVAQWFSAGALTVRADSALLVPEAGLRWDLARRWTLGFDAVSLPLYLSDRTVAVSYRVALWGALRF